MKEITFITGNQNKADYLAKYLGLPIKHVKLDLDEIQSLDLKKIIGHKVRQAYEIIQGPVIVEDVSLEFKALGRLPGPLIKYFLEELSEEQICNLVNGNTREAIAKCMFGYFDGKDLQMFENGLGGKIPQTPAGENGFGFDRIFIPEGYSSTRAELNEEDDRKTYLKIKPFDKLKQFLQKNNE